MSFKEFIADIALIGAALALLVAFIIIGIRGVYTAVDENPYIWGAEVALFLLILGLGIERLVNDIKKMKKK